LKCAVNSLVLLGIPIALALINDVKVIGIVQTIGKGLVGSKIMLVAFLLACLVETLRDIANFLNLDAGH
jgi:hypothetical protein